MSVPCIGAVLTSALLTCNVRECFRVAMTPSPMLQMSSHESSSDDGDSNGSSEPGGYSEAVRQAWPTVSHAGSGFSPKELRNFLQKPGGSVR